MLLTIKVCCAGYLIISLALVVFVQSHNVYPQLLLARLLFSLGGSAASTMVTAILPAMAGNAEVHGLNKVSHSTRSRHTHATSVASDLTVTPATYRVSPLNRNNELATRSDSISKIAGFVGTSIYLEMLWQSLEDCAIEG